jgi:hypothetical protein
LGNLFAAGPSTLLALFTGEGRAHHSDILAQAAVLGEAGKLTPLLNERRFSIVGFDGARTLVES